MDKNVVEKWHDSNLTANTLFCEKIQALIADIVSNRNIQVHSITGRVKEKDSLLRKIGMKLYKNVDEITDIVGIRVIVFILEDVYKICEIVKNEFDVDIDNSTDKSSELKENETGYQSVHYILKLAAPRCNLSEWGVYQNRVFEIQIRTLLQHAWAEMSHNNQYKFSGVLPKEINRRFYLTAGTLELLDIEFQRLSDELNNYKNLVSNETTRGNLNIEINTTWLLGYLDKKVDDLISKSSFRKEFYGEDDRIIKELKKFGIHSIADLDAIMPKRFNKNHENVIIGYDALLRHVMIISDTRKYFEYCLDYTSSFWEEEIEALKHYVVDLDELIGEYNVRVLELPF